MHADEIIEVIADQILENPDNVTFRSKLREDFDLDDFDLIELGMALQEGCSIKEIPNQVCKNFKTVEDIINYVNEKRGE